MAGIERIYAGQRAPIPPVRLPDGTTAGRAEALRLRLLPPDGRARVVTGVGSPLKRDPLDALSWGYTGTADAEGIWEWQWEWEGAVLAYGRFRVRGTGFSG